MVILIVLVADRSSETLPKCCKWPNEILYCSRYLDNNLINGTLDIAQLSALGLLNKEIKKSTNSTGLLRILSLANNSITNVIYDTNSIEDIITVLR
jgi:hypothetical protein